MSAPTSTDRPAAQVVQDLAVAYWVSRCLHLVAELGVADHLGDTPATADTLAQACGLQPRALNRVLRALANHGIFGYDGQFFAHNAASLTLRSDASGSTRSLARMMGLKVHWDAYRELDVTLRSGTPSIAAVTDGGLFPYLRAHPGEGRLFHEAMAGKSYAQVRPVIQAYDFRSFRTIGDIGGGLGHLLYGVLDQTPASRGMLFDLPEVIEEARQRADERVTYVGGDFFKTRIPACDAYLMMTVLHDWSDAEAVTILTNLKSNSPRAAKLLLVEGIVRAETQNDFVKDLDIEMLVMTTGRERTQAEWNGVLQSAGFRLARVIPAGAWSSILEAEIA
ncbi:MAG TPA: methyltransferase [Steroidobacteraceae bacterium]|nr:methyltransferase [Steroidobacteraceae bacterium]